MRGPRGCMELCLGKGDEMAGSLWVRTSEQTNIGDIVVDVCYRPPDKWEYMRPSSDK